MTNKNTIITITLLLALVLGGYYYTRTSKEAGIQNASQGKINVDEVCRQALIYMTFADSVSAELFVQECKDGKQEGKPTRAIAISPPFQK